jgi:fucose permease
MSSNDNQNSESDLLSFISLSLAVSLILFYFSTNGLADDFVSVAWMIPVFPIISFVAILLFGHMDSRKGGSFALAGIGLSAIFSLAIAYDVLIQNSLNGEYVESVCRIN